jgi:hypothetical protein
MVIASLPAGPGRHADDHRPFAHRPQLQGRCGLSVGVPTTRARKCKLSVRTGYLSDTGRPFRGRIVQHIRRDYQLRSRYVRLRARGLLTRDEIADALNVSPGTVKVWDRHGLLRRYVSNDKGEYTGDQASMPPEERIRRSDRRNLTQRLTSQPECPRGESPSVIIREAEAAPAPTQRRTQDTISLRADRRARPAPGNPASRSGRRATSGEPIY